MSELEGYAERGCILAVGDLALRRTMIGRLGAAMLTTVIHPRAFVSPSATIGRGVYVGPDAVVHSRAVIADHAIVNSGCIVEHECRIGENAHIAPGAIVGGRGVIGADTLMGLGARMLPGFQVGRSSIVGAGATVTQDFGDHVRIAGTPAKPI